MKNIIKNISFSLIAIGLFFVLLEGACRLFSFPGTYEFIERSAIQQGLKHKKDKGEFRIFMFGESTMHGNHLFPKSTIAKWTELYLEELVGKQAADQVTITNFGRLGVNSDFIKNAFKETLHYKPDLVVFYTAHNDFIQLENRRQFFNPKLTSSNTDPWYIVLFKKCYFTSTINRLFVKQKIRRREKRYQGKKIVDHWFDERNQKKHDPKTDLLVPHSENFEKLRQHWISNVREISTIAQENNIPVIFFEGISRWKDFPPFESVHKSNLEQVDIDYWQLTFEKAQKAYDDKDYLLAIELYKRCLGIDAQHALLHYRMAEAYEKLNVFVLAKQHYFLSNEYDFFPVRAPSAINQFYESFTDENHQNVFVIPTQKIFEKQSLNGLVNFTLILDQIHPTVKGQALMALEILKIMEANNFIDSKQPWSWDQIKAVGELEEKLGMDDEFMFDMYLASAKYVGSYHDRAIEFLLEALKVKPDSVGVKSQLAWTYLRKGERSTAIGIYKELNAEAPDLARDFFKRHPKLAEEIRGE